MQCQRLFQWSSGEVGGLHNWVRFATLERASSIDYKGYIVRRYVRCIELLAHIIYTLGSDGFSEIHLGRQSETLRFILCRNKSRIRSRPLHSLPINTRHRESRATCM